MLAAFFGLLHMQPTLRLILLSCSVLFQPSGILLLASYMSGVGDKDLSLQAFQVRSAELSWLVRCHLCAWTVQSCCGAPAGADEEFRLSMEFLRPAYGQVKPSSVPIVCPVATSW